MRTLTDPGWPRPFIAGVPIPWVSSPYNLGETDPARRADTKTFKSCQVCGLKHPPGGEAVIFLNGPLEWNRNLDKGDLRGVELRAMDDGMMHRHCALLAAQHCPKLSQLRLEERLFAFAGPIDAIEVKQELAVPGKVLDYVILRGELARVFDIRKERVTP